MAFPPIYQDLFQNEGEGPKLRPDILPDIKLAGDTTGSVRVNEDGDYEIDVTTEATKLKTARAIALSGQASGSANFDGSENVSIPVTSVKADQWNESKTLQLSGDVSGSAKADWSANTITIDTSVTSLSSGCQGSTWKSAKLIKTLSPGTSWTTTADGYFVVHSSGSSEGSGGKTNWGVKATVGDYSWGMIYGSHYSYGTDTCVWPVKKGYAIKIAALDGSNNPNSHCNYRFFSAE